jgi:U3 small nucleolar RNA-associated protein 15
VQFIRAAVITKKMNNFPKLKLKQYPQVQDRESSESKFWRNYVIANEEKLNGAPNYIHFDPSGSGQYIVTASTKISLFDPLSDKVQRAYSRFEDDAYCGKFRRDGKLITAGDKTGCVKVFDVATKTVLRQMRRHSTAVRATCWTSDALHILSGSDDKSIALFDLATGDNIWHKHHVHADYIRHVDASSVDNNFFVSGSYDHAVNLWDRRQDAPVRSLDHGCPVSGTILTPSGTLLITSGGNEVKVWDIASGYKVLHTFACHQKDIANITLDASGSRIFSAGLDGHLKICSLQSLSLLHGIKCTGPLSCASLSTDNNKLVIGYVDSKVEVRSKSVLEAELETSETEAGFSAAAVSRKRKYNKRAGVDISENVDGEDEQDAIVETERNVKLKPYESHLKKFHYQQALDAALKTRNPLIVYTVVEELTRRSGLVEALSGRDEITLEPILSFVCKYISNPKYTRLLVTVCHNILDIYAASIGHSDGIDELMLKLQMQVRNEVSFQRRTMRIAGSLDAIVQSTIRAFDN